MAALRQAEPGLRGVVLGVNLSRSNVILGESYRTLWGEDHLMDTLCGLEFRLSVPSFYQVNPDQTEVLYGLAVDYAGLTGTETVLDFYCGIGTITLCLARKAKKAIGAEVVPQAIEDAKANALRNGLHNTEFFCGDAGEVAQRFAREGVRPDVITVDPPRKGLAAEVVEAIAGMAPARVVYVSCDPATLARDIARFAEQGYQPQKITAVDLFPAPTMWRPSACSPGAGAAPIYKIYQRLGVTEHDCGNLFGFPGGVRRPPGSGPGGGPHGAHQPSAGPAG